MPADARRGIMVMGVAGCGKTSVAEGLAAALGVPMVEGDALHPEANIRKMSAGTPLTDADRWPWLDAVAHSIDREPADAVVVTCSALKRSYRDRLRRGSGRRLNFVYLHGTPELLASRIGARAGHFMPAGLLASQLEALEDPTDEPGVICVEIDAPIGDIVSRAHAALMRRGYG